MAKMSDSSTVYPLYPLFHFQDQFTELDLVNLANLHVSSCTELNVAISVQATSGPPLPIEPRCRLCIHIPHYPQPNLYLTLTLILTLMSSYLTNKHRKAQRDMSAYWMTSRLCDQSAAQCKNCRCRLACTQTLPFYSGSHQFAELTLAPFVSKCP